MKTRLTIILTLFTFLTASSIAQERTKHQKLNEPGSLHNPANPQKDNIEISNLNYNFRISHSHNNQVIDSGLSQQLQNVLDDAINNYEIKGLSAALQTNIGDTWVGVSGVSYDTVTIKPEMLFGIGSITKNFIATIILQLYEEGSLSLNDSLFKWVPSFPNINSTATIKQLLNHTSGIYNYLNYPGIDDTVQAYESKIWTPEEILHKFVLQAYFPPGTDWGYSNTNYILLGLIIEEVTGNSVLDELHNRLTIPLGLDATFFYPDEDFVGTRAHCWMTVNNTLTDVTEIENASWYSVYWTAGAILSTPEQIVNWQKGLYEGNLLNDTTLNLMKQPAPYSNGIYGLGTQISSINEELIYGHTGDVVYYSQLYYVPSNSLSIAVISNTRFAPVNAIWEDLYDIYLSFQPCLPEGVVFTTQAQIDNFKTNYPNCSEIEGDVVISGSDITNLDSLSILKVIGGDLEIHTNETLENLSGLNGLESLNGDLLVYSNNILGDFSGLENLTSINGNLKIYDNGSLSSLTGLENIEPESIVDLIIAENENLSYCHINSICYYLFSGPNGSVKIQDNDTGCNDSLTVRQSCLPPVSVNDLKHSIKLSIQPNPFTTSTTLTYELSQPSTIQITIYNHLGKQLEIIQQNQSSGKQQVVWNAKGLPSGIYYFRLQAGEQVASGKMVVVK